MTLTSTPRHRTAWYEAVFADPGPFIAAAVDEARRRNFSGCSSSRVAAEIIKPCLRRHPTSVDTIAIRYASSRGPTGPNSSSNQLRQVQPRHRAQRRPGRADAADCEPHLRRAVREGEKDAESAQKLGQHQPATAVFPPGSARASVQRASFGPT